MPTTVYVLHTVHIIPTAVYVHMYVLHIVQRIPILQYTVPMYILHRYCTTYTYLLQHMYYALYNLYRYGTYYSTCTTHCTTCTYHLPKLMLTKNYDDENVLAPT